jgi:enoyl-CoA hydratase/carnithine racemase
MPVEDRDSARIAVMTIDRPEKRNALTPDMLANIESGAAMLRSDEGRADALVLAGAGKVFCAGFDLSLCRDDEQMMAALLTRLSGAIQALRRLPAPVVVAAHGGAIAGGCALLGGADIVVSDREAKLGYPVIRLGVSPSVNAPAIATAVSGSALRRLMLDPKLISGEEGMRFGLVHELVDSPDQVRDRAIEIATDLARKPPHGMHATKRWMNEIDRSDDAALFQSALEASLSLAGGDEERRLLRTIWENNG